MSPSTVRRRARSLRTSTVRRLVIALTTALVVVIAPLLSSDAASGQPASDVASHSPTARPTIVLVHGAFADASGWDATISRLERAGYPVLAPPDPLRGLTADADYLRAFLATVSGPVVLVGHSYGGAVITNAARGLDSVKALVYVAAFVPDTGEAIGTMLDPAKYPGSLLDPSSLVVRPVPNASAPNGQDGDVYIALDRFRAVFAADVPAGQADLMARTQRPLALTANFEPSGEPAWRTIPSWDLITTQDKAIPPAGQWFMAKRAGAHIASVASAHDVMVSHPTAVTRIILQAARSVS